MYRCTNVYNVIRAAKTGPNRLARTCPPGRQLQREQEQSRGGVLLRACPARVPIVFISEKLLCSCVHRWYDEINLIYGPVGHTHTGIDATHCQHNQVSSPLSALARVCLSVSSRALADTQSLLSLTWLSFTISAG